MSIAGGTPVGLNKAPAFVILSSIPLAVGQFLGARSSYGFDAVELYWIDVFGPILPAESITVRIHRTAFGSVDMGPETNLRNQEQRTFPTNGADIIDFEVTAINTGVVLPQWFIAGVAPLRFQAP